MTLFSKVEKIENSFKLLQMKYYHGKKQSNGQGHKINQSDLLRTNKKLRDEFEKDQLTERAYFIDKSVVLLKSKSAIDYVPVKKGKLGLKLIGHSEENLKKLANKLNLPYDRQRLASYHFKTKIEHYLVSFAKD